MGRAIERLDFQEIGTLPAIEVAIHVARYLAARQYCAGKTVLDIACGEGYGSFLMAERWGAARVHGVDISGDAIARAKQFFASPRVEYHAAGAEELEARFQPGSFDLIVCLETFEHVADPGAMLASFRRLLRPGGTVLLSCPNDHCYYHSPDESNPFHVRRYTFDEFRNISEQALGPASAFLVGAPIAGYVTCDPALGEVIDSRSAPHVQIDARSEARALITAPDQPANWSNCSYFMGVWGPATLRPEPSTVLYPVNMHVLPPHRQAQFASLRDDAAKAVQRQYELESELQAELARGSAKQSEWDAAWREQNAKLREIEAAHRDQAERWQAQQSQTEAAIEELKQTETGLREEIEALRTAAEAAREDFEERAAALQARFNATDRELRTAGLRAAAALAENEFIRHECIQLRDAAYQAGERERTLREQVIALGHEPPVPAAVPPKQVVEIEPEWLSAQDLDIVDMRRRLANIDRLKRLIPRPIWNLLRRVLVRP